MLRNLGSVFTSYQFLRSQRGVCTGPGTVVLLGAESTLNAVNSGMLIARRCRAKRQVATSGSFQPRVVRS